jgi:hypothetical protein
MIDGLRDLVRRLRETGQPSRIQIVGGSAKGRGRALVVVDLCEAPDDGFEHGRSV